MISHIRRNLLSYISHELLYNYEIVINKYIPHRKKIYINNFKGTTYSNPLFNINLNDISPLQIVDHPTLFLLDNFGIELSSNVSCIEYDDKLKLIFQNVPASIIHMIYDFTFRDIEKSLIISCIKNNKKHNLVRINNNTIISNQLYEFNSFFGFNNCQYNFLDNMCYTQHNYVGFNNFINESINNLKRTNFNRTLSYDVYLFQQILKQCDDKYVEYVINKLIDYLYNKNRLKTILNFYSLNPNIDFYNYQIFLKKYCVDTEKCISFNFQKNAILHNNDILYNYFQDQIIHKYLLYHINPSMVILPNIEVVKLCELSKINKN